MSKRHIPRIELNCAVTYHDIGSNEHKKGQALDYSNTGVSFLTPENLAEGCLQEVHIENPGIDDMPPLHAIIEVVRCQPSTKNLGQYEIAGMIKTHI